MRLRRQKGLFERQPEKKTGVGGRGCGGARGGGGGASLSSASSKGESRGNVKEKVWVTGCGCDQSRERFGSPVSAGPRLEPGKGSPPLPRGKRRPGQDPAACPGRALPPPPPRALCPSGQCCTHSWRPGGPRYGVGLGVLIPEYRCQTLHGYATQVPRPAPF